MADVRTKALSYLRDGKVRILHSLTQMDGPRVPYEVDADVEGFRSTYLVRLTDGVWSCSCHGSGEGCSHIAAVQLVTGHDSAAAKPEKRGRAA
jgi:hypothetical protein